MPRGSAGSDDAEATVGSAAESRLDAMTERLDRDLSPDTAD